jgi:isopentenyl diphosphate isomerase/L-lactate dehydrogenase-like FMN-dependent dehydrogenase
MRASDANLDCRGIYQPRNPRATKAAVECADAVTELLERFIRELKLAMFCTGSARPADLRRAIRKIDG